MLFVADFIYKDTILWQILLTKILVVADFYIQRYYVMADFID